MGREREREKEMGCNLKQENSSQNYVQQTMVPDQIQR